MDSAVRFNVELIDLTFKIAGMTCASCVARVEKALKSVPSVGSALINLETEKAIVRGYPAIVFGSLSAEVEKCRAKAFRSRFLG